MAKSVGRAVPHGGASDCCDSSMGSAILGTRWTSVFSAFGSNMFLFQFESEESSRWVFENGPWHCENVPLFLRKWVLGIQSVKMDYTKLPIWVRIRELPPEYMTVE
ncbi:unnamed protein product [Linum trigynum]|uniref:DUF4283 domain-containing protein n=1 Tax=Linum trigynum TaxID=586398 RepID=A0AAV2GM16_9ROSI